MLFLAQQVVQYVLVKHLWSCYKDFFRSQNLSTGERESRLKRKGQAGERYWPSLPNIQRDSQE